MREGFDITKHTMELVWHSCTDHQPEEDYNPCLHVTDGNMVMAMRWKRDPHWRRFESGGWYIEPGINSEGYWWADLIQTANGFAPIQKRQMGCDND